MVCNNSGYRSGNTTVVRIIIIISSSSSSSSSIRVECSSLRLHLLLLFPVDRINENLFS